MTEEKVIEISEETVVLARALAKERAGQIIDLSLALLKWLYASMLSLNGAGLVALLNTDIDVPFWARIAAILFVSGLVFALLAVFVAIRMGTNAVEAMDNIFWFEPGAYSQRELEKAIEMPSFSPDWSSRLAWISVVCFILGAISFALAIDFNPA